MKIGKIIKGHLNEVMGNNDSLYEKRIAICKACPLFKQTKTGPVCNPKLYLDPVTNEYSMIEREGYFKGCGCRLNAKTRDEDSKCPSSKW